MEEVKMSEDKNGKLKNPRNRLAYVTLGFSAFAITAISITAIAVEPENTMTVFKSYPHDATIRRRNSD